MSLYANGTKVCPTICMYIYLLNLDGGKALQTYTAEQRVDGGKANSIYGVNDIISGGHAQWQL